MMAPFTLDDMRRDLSEALALDARAIADDDSLQDLGLDSMRAMALVLRWQSRGLQLSFPDLAERPTLSDWWSLAEARLRAGESS